MSLDIIIVYHYARMSVNISVLSNRTSEHEGKIIFYFFQKFVSGIILRTLNGKNLRYFHQRFQV
ncbi:hypothetical protein CUU66_01855 [Peribacillus deserti]|uniref:Uncharacterized protein n=1 Tax=Peribacillus deserti TaxID=673318 RepID=A0A2N5MBE0_9BACI|nr:hypothetical protein CUU66_01855 [Peribacillus deserti]